MEALIKCMWDEEPGVANRAADAVERLTAKDASLIQKWKAPLLGLLAEARVNKLRWNLALIVTRLRLTLNEARAVAQLFEEQYLADPSSIVRTLALHGLYNLGRQHAALEAEAIEMLQRHGLSGTPAMRARSRILLKKIESRSSTEHKAKATCGL